MVSQPDVLPNTDAGIGSSLGIDNTRYAIPHDSEVILLREDGSSVGRGFVHHPEVAPFISGIAVFHQLHCLVRLHCPTSPIKTSLIWIQHGIRVAYYTTLHQLESANGSVVPDTYLEELSERTDNVHMRHCFDYLRHALMCAADTNLETVDPETRVTTGWNSERQCRDYASVLAWAEQWRNSSDTGIH